MLLRAITSNLRNCPFALRCVMKRIYEKSKAIFHDEPSAGYIAVSSFLFLRFFVPALQNPTLVDIFIDTVSIRPKRTFTLLSKILQKISNLCEFGVEKEGYMTPLNRFVPDYHPIITTYIAEICRVRTETSPTTNLQHQELVSRSLFSVKIKPTFSEKYLMCCFRPPQDDLSESMDMFRQPGTFDVDSESSNDMDSPVDELSLAVIDTELHLSALIRHINICKDRMMMLVDPNNAHQVYPHLVKLLSFDKKDKKHSTSEELSYKHIRKLLLKNSTFSDTPRLQTASNPLGIEITLTSPTVPFVDTTTKFIDRGETVTSDSPLSAFLPRLGKGTSPAPTFLSPVLPFETIMESSCSGSFDGGLAASIRDNEATCNAPLEGKSSSPIISRSDDQAFHHDTPASIESLTADALVENVDSHSPESLKPGYTESEEDVKEQYLQSFNHTSKSESLRSIQGSSELVEQPPMIPDAILAMDEPMDLPNDDEETSPESDIFFSTVEHANEGALLTGIEDHGKPISQSNSVMDEDEADAYVIQKRPSVASSSKTPSQTSSASIGEDKRGSMKHRRSITSIKDAARRRSSAFAFKGGLANAMYRKQSVVTGSDESVHEDPIFDFLHTVGKKGKVTAQYAAPGPSGNNRRKSSHQLSESGSFIVRKNR